MMIAVHCGAGEYNCKTICEYSALNRKACRKGIAQLLAFSSAAEAVREAVIVLENNPLTNAGFGSNLTQDGVVEMDAALMVSGGDEIRGFGACAAVQQVKNPICLAYEVYKKQLHKSPPLGLVPPALVVDRGAYQLAVATDLQLATTAQLTTPKALRQYTKYINRLDTVGAICVDQDGNMAAACSSGGLLLKQPGRVGHSAHFGAGVWADGNVATCTTGCGEYLIYTALARSVAEDLTTMDGPESLHNSVKKRFMQSKFVTGVKLAGVLALASNNNQVSLMWAQTTKHLGVAWMTVKDVKPKSQLSQMPDGLIEGQSVVVGGAELILDH